MAINLFPSFVVREIMLHYSPNSNIRIRSDQNTPSTHEVRGLFDIGQKDIIALWVEMFCPWCDNVFSTYIK